MKSGRRSRKSVRYSIFIGVLAGSVFSASGAFADSPTPILTPGDLLSVVSAGNYQLAADIDLTGQTPGGASSYIQGIFGGRLDGLKEVSADGTKINWKITGLSMPLFDGIVEDLSPGNIDGLSVIKNIDLITQTEGVTGRGIVANWSNNSVIDNVHVSGKLTNSSDSDEVGGIIGRANIISNSSADVILTNDTNYTGGLAGTAISITNSTSSGVLTINGDKNFTGGIVGQINSSLNNASSSMAVNSEGDYVGGLVGSGSGEISSSNSSGEIVGRNYVGGLIGQSESNLLLEGNVVSANVSGNGYVGGMVGLVGGTGMYPSAANLTVTGGEVSGLISGISYIGGVVGGVTQNASFENVSATGNVESVNENSGGLAGWVRSLATVNNSKVTGNVEGTNNVGGLLGFIGDASYYSTTDASTTITNSFKSGTTIGAVAGDPFGGSEYVGGLIGRVFGNADIDAAYNLGIVSGSSYVGGLIGSAKSGHIDNSYVATGAVSANSYVGGLAGQVDSFSISNSYSTSDVYVNTSVGGGLIGTTSNSTIDNSIMQGNIFGAASADVIGGISGFVEASNLTNVHFSGGISGRDAVGGLVGVNGLGVEISNSTTSGTVQGRSGVAGFIGQGSGGSAPSEGLRISNSESVMMLTGSDSIGGILGWALSTASGTAITTTNTYWNGSINAVVPAYSGTAVGYAYRTDQGYFDIYGNWNPPAFNSHSLEAVFINGAYGVRQVNFTEPLTGSVEMREPTSVLQDFVTEYNPEKTWSVCSTVNGTFPYLISMYAADPCFVDSGSGGDDDGSIDTPRRERIEKELREVKEARIPDKIEKSLGFKNETPLPKSALITFVESTEKIDITKVKAVEIAPTANVKVVAKAGEALQISLKSESKEPVELWVKSPDGSWLLAGVITFDKDGKAILPALQFKNAGDYTLVLNKPSAESAKGSAPLNQSGSVLVAVS